MLNKLKKSLSKKELKVYSEITKQINQATNYSSLVKEIPEQSTNLGYEIGTLLKDEVNYPKINKIRRELKKLILAPDSQK